jgi:hypothetical protein
MKITHAIGATVIVTIAAYAQTMGGTDKISRVREGIQHVPAADGQRINYQNFAAYAWHEPPATPDRPDGTIDATGTRVLRWPILAYYPSSPNPIVVWYHDGAFRSSNGNRWGGPSRWAYVRMDEEVWNETKRQWEIPGLGYTAPPPTAPIGNQGVHMNATQGQWMVDDLKRSFTTAQIQDMLDASPYDEPDTGAPEAGAGEQG